MTPVIAPCAPPYSAGVTDDLAALMPPGAPPIALFRVLAHNPRILSAFSRRTFARRRSIVDARTRAS